MEFLFIKHVGMNGDEHQKIAMGWDSVIIMVAGFGKMIFHAADQLSSLNKGF